MEKGLAAPLVAVLGVEVDEVEDVEVEMLDACPLRLDWRTLVVVLGTAKVRVSPLLPLRAERERDRANLVPSW